MSIECIEAHHQVAQWGVAMAEDLVVEIAVVVEMGVVGEIRVSVQVSNVRSQCSSYLTFSLARKKLHQTCGEIDLGISIDTTLNLGKA